MEGGFRVVVPPRTPVAVHVCARLTPLGTVAGATQPSDPNAVVVSSRKQNSRMKAAADPLVRAVPKYFPAETAHVSPLQPRIGDPTHARGLRTGSAVARRVLVRPRERL
eukprot:scaffold1518_cov331-Pavlova_lutheri.AAC.25